MLIKYYSVNYFQNRGTTIGTDLGRISARVNLDYTVSDKIRFSSDISYTHIDRQDLFTSVIRDVAYNKMPNQSIYEYDEYGNITPNYFSPASTAQGSFFYDFDRKRVSGTFNPVAMANAANNHQLGERITPKFSLQYQIIPERLRLNGSFMVDINNSKTKMFLPQIATGRPFTEAVVNNASDGDGIHLV